MAVVGKVRVDMKLLSAAPHLRFIAATGTGVDHIDLPACERAGVLVANVPGYAQQSVSEHVIAMIFALRRNLLGYRDAIRAGRWQQANNAYFMDYPIADLAGSTLGIVGAGDLGRRVADIAAALGMQVIMAARKRDHTPPAGRVRFDELLSRADVISLHCPSVAETHHLIGAREFALMTRRPILVNTARGSIVDEAALVEALRNGQVAGAAFDVASTEPPPAGHPLMQLLEMPNFILTPHVAWGSIEAQRRLADGIVTNIEAFQRGRPRNIICASEIRPGT